MSEKIWVAELETRHYSFTGYGKTEEEAKQAILNEWKKNNWNYYFSTDINTMEELNEFSEIITSEITLGECEVR